MTPIDFYFHHFGRHISTESKTAWAEKSIYTPSKAPKKPGLLTRFSVGSSVLVTEEHVWVSSTIRPVADLPAHITWQDSFPVSLKERVQLDLALSRPLIGMSFSKKGVAWDALRICQPGESVWFENSGHTHCASDVLLFNRLSSHFTQTKAKLKALPSLYLSSISNSLSTPKLKGDYDQFRASPTFSASIHLLNELIAGDLVPAFRKWCDAKAT